LYISTLFFNGRCKEAIEQYKKAFGAEVVLSVPFPEGNKKKGIEHSELFIRGHKLWFSDEGAQGQGQVIVFDTLGELMKAWDIMKGEAEILLAPQETRWSVCEAILKDKFGFTWGFIVYDERTFKKP
jgi:PhnB protein